MKASRLYPLVLSGFLLGCQPKLTKEQTRFQSRYVAHTTVGAGSPVVATVVADSLDVPWEITWGADGWLWFTEQRGTVNRLNPQTGERRVLLQLTDVLYQKSQGLLGMALHPDFEKHPSVYLDYTYLRPDSAMSSKLVRYTYEKNTLIHPQILLQDIPGRKFHNGARLVITPDEKLFLSTGEAGNPKAAQDIRSLSGKILRMNLDGTVPGDNPVRGSLVWSWGHRNPQGLVLSPNGTLYESEHGPDNDDEVNLIRKGRNYGWPDAMGFCDLESEKRYCTDSAVAEPLLAWSSIIAPSGMVFYNHDAIPEWKNSLIMGSLKNQSLRVLQLNGSGDRILTEKIYFPKVFGRIRDVCVSPAGDVYLVTSNRDWHPRFFPVLYDQFPRPSDDRIIRLSPVTPQQVAWLQPLAAPYREEKPAVQLTAATAPETGLAVYGQYCAGCHQPEGTGVAGLYPPLARTGWVNGDKHTLIRTVLYGLSKPIEVNGKPYHEQMPPYKFLSDRQVAAVLTFIRSSFGNQSAAVAPEEVAAARNQ